MEHPLQVAFLDSWARGRARGSGSTAAIQGLAGALRRLGHEVTELLPRVGRPGTTTTRLAYNLGLPFRLVPADYDLVVGFDLDGCFLPVDRRRTADGAVRVASVKGVMADEMRFERGATRLRFRLLAGLEGRAVRRAHRVVVTSRYCREVVSRAYGVPASRISIVPEGLDLDRWERRRRERPRGGTGARDDDAPVVLSVARQYPRKDTGTLLRAFPRVRREVPSARLRIVGGGPELEALRREARRLSLADAVTFLGDVEDHGAVMDEYSRADVFCLPSLQEGFGIVFLEAMAAGLPVVACRVAAVPEVVPDGETGLLVPPRRPREVADALVRLLRSPGRRRRLGEAGRERVERYDWPRVGRRFLDAVLGRGGGRRPGCTRRAHG